MLWYLLSHYTTVAVYCRVWLAIIVDISTCGWTQMISISCGYKREGIAWGFPMELLNFCISKQCAYFYAYQVNSFCMVHEGHRSWTPNIYWYTIYTHGDCESDTYMPNNQTLHYPSWSSWIFSIACVTLFDHHPMYTEQAYSMIIRQTLIVNVSIGIGTCSSYVMGGSIAEWVSLMFQGVACIQLQIYVSILSLDEAYDDQVMFVQK